MKTIPLILGIFAALCFAFGQTVQVAHVSPQFVDNGDRVLLIKGNIARETKTWLVIEAHNGREWNTDGFSPTYTRVISDYMPLFRRLPNGQWEIMFTSEIAKNLP